VALNDKVSSPMHIYKVAVVGAGPAGSIAAIRAAQLKKDIILIERNASLGKKILLTGKGRCNLTNIASIETFIEKFGKQGQFLRSAFFVFFNLDVMAFFESKGLAFKTERQGRVFPATDRASSVVSALKQSLKENSVDECYNRRLQDIKRESSGFKLCFDKGNSVNAKKVILSTGGVSYKETGSSGDGLNIAKKLGHTLSPLIPALVPLKTKEKWVAELKGLSLRNVRISFECARKKITSGVGECVFTHFGISGPLILDLSGEVISFLKDNKCVRLLIDLKPGMKPEQLEKRLLNEFIEKGKMQLKNIMKNLLPHNLVPVVINLAGLDPKKEVNQITKEQRNTIIRVLKRLPLTITGSLPIEEAMVTCGGVSTKEINPRTMESKIVPGLYFAGEIIDGCASSGGYNLQQAFSTGYLAGESAAKCEE